MKTYKERSLDGIEYDVFEVVKGEKYSSDDLLSFISDHKYTLFRKVGENGFIVHKVIHFKNGRIHNEYDYAIIDFKDWNNIFQKPKCKRFLNGKQYHDEESYINEIRRIRLDEILQD